jgi:UDP-N-acetylmuramoyl-L-alanyl-D-glutamate--2,6-diaminopimelate ligase
MKLAELSNKIPCQIFGNKDIAIKGISQNSQKTKPGDIFVALNGYRTSGKIYISDAIKHGAIAVVTDDKSIIENITKRSGKKITGILIRNPRQFLTTIANRFYDFPSKKLTLIGITGTDGKTTTSYMIKSIIEASGKKTGLIGTIKYFNGKTWSSATNTTPDSLDFIKFLAQLVKGKISYCISEVSSHALALDRVAGLDFKIGVFTNLAQDHLDFHKTKKAYGLTKLKLFTNLLPDAVAIINNDDPFSKNIIKQTKANKILYSLRKKSDIWAQIKVVDFSKIKSQVYFKNSLHPLTINLPMLGTHNVYNMLAAISTTKALKISNRYIKLGLEQLPIVPGRLERIKNNKGLNVFVDYAHTAEALRIALQTLNQVTKGKLIVVFGCGGNRDKIKRPQMGKIATDLADYVIITSDNPRNEDPTIIISDIKKGISKNNYQVITDRKQAIKMAILLAKPEDTILIAGKGHEQYQIIGDKTIPFCDKEIVLQSCICD